nr:hypothetical protein [Tanacetum cinerariifolium]
MYKEDGAFLIIEVDNYIFVKLKRLVGYYLTLQEIASCPLLLFLFISSDSNHEAAVIPAMLHFALEAEVVVVALPADVLDLVIHNDTESDPSEDPPSFDHAPVTLGISLFLSDDDYDSDSESDPFEDSSQGDASKAPLSPQPYVATITGWRNAVLLRTRVTTRKRVKEYKLVMTPALRSSHSSSSSETSYESSSDFDSPFFHQIFLHILLWYFLDFIWTVA